MLAKSLVIFIGIGVVAGLVFGIYLIDVKNTNQLIYVDGSSVSIVTEKFDFKQDESIRIRIVNSGTVPISFPDSTYGLRITGLSGILMYSPEISGQQKDTSSVLEQGSEAEFLWDQVKNDGGTALEGVYKISARGTDEEGDDVERSTIVTIWK